MVISLRIEKTRSETRNNLLIDNILVMYMKLVIWKRVIIEGIESKYIINPDGEIINTETGRYMKGGLDARGYVRVTIREPSIGFKKAMKLHQLVAKAFIPNPHNYTQINHIDGNKQNNSIENLEWCTSKHNVQHAHRLGLRKGQPGTSNGACTHEEYEIRNVCELIAQGLGATAIARLTGLERGLIQDIINGRLWTTISKDYDFSKHKFQHSYKKYHEEINILIYRGYTNKEIYDQMKNRVDIPLPTLKRIIYQRRWGIEHGKIPNVLSIKFRERSTTIP